MLLKYRINTLFKNDIPALSSWKNIVLYLIFIIDLYLLTFNRTKLSKLLKQYLKFNKQNSVKLAKLMEF